MRHGLLNRHDLVGPALPLAHLPQDFLLSLDGFRRGELPRGTVLRRGDKLKFAGGQTLFDTRANLRVGRFAHAAPQGIAEEGALVGDGLALEAAFAGKGHCFLGGLLRLFGSALGGFLFGPLTRRGHNLIRLIAELGGQLAMRRKHFGGRLNLLLVARGMGGDLRRLVAGETILLHVCEDLILALARSVKILLRISFDLRCAASAGRDLVAQVRATGRSTPTGRRQWRTAATRRNRAPEAPVSFRPHAR